jgi:hypothetical protein
MYELERIWKGAIVAKFNVLCRGKSYRSENGHIVNHFANIGRGSTVMLK